MITLRPLARALVPRDSGAAARLAAPNYDEFQDDREIWAHLQESPECVLRVTMAHCDATAPDAIGSPDSEEALSRASTNMVELGASPDTRELRQVLFVYAIDGPQARARPQVGLGGMARTREIRTAATPAGPIIRNEGIRLPKVKGRARLIHATHSIIGIVSCAVPDPTDELGKALDAYAARPGADLQVTDRHGNRHRIWFVSEEGESARLRSLLATQDEAYVADGNHRSAAAAMLGHEGFLAIFFPAARMRIAPYNRLVRDVQLSGRDLTEQLRRDFEVAVDGGDRPIQPEFEGEVGLFMPEMGWLRARRRSGLFAKGDVAGSIDHDIVQRRLFAELLGIDDEGDGRLVFVGGDRDAAWLQGRVEQGSADLAVTLPPVTMEQFAAVCRQGRMMPPKSTWFEPKIMSGLVIALLDSGGPPA